MPHDPAAAAAARRYRELGFNPLPSCGDAKRPALRRYARFLTEPIPEKWLEKWWAPNIQVPTGVAWRLAVIDLDGPAALIRWLDLARAAAPGAPPTWTVRTGGGGLHLWYRTPAGLTACPTRKLWGLWDVAGNRWHPHTYIELKGDRGLVVAPPSKHVPSGVPYRFLPGRAPRDLGPPAEIPAWVLALPPLHVPRSATPSPASPPALVRSRRPGCDPGRRPAWRAVLDALSPAQKLDLARSWGLRVAGTRVNPAGWISCHAVDREDRNPSAGFCPETGYYAEPGVRRMNMFDLGVELRAYPTWIDCLNDLGEMAGL